MTTLLLLVGFVVMAATFVAAAWRSPRHAKGLGLAILALSAPFFFWLGGFSERFKSGQCYSNAIEMVANAVEETGAARELSKSIRALPLEGYETVCSDVEAAARQLPNAGAH